MDIDRQVLDRVGVARRVSRAPLSYMYGRGAECGSPERQKDIRIRLGFASKDSSPICNDSLPREFRRRG